MRPLYFGYHALGRTRELTMLLLDDLLVLVDGPLQVFDGGLDLLRAEAQDLARIGCHWQ